MGTVASSPTEGEFHRPAIPPARPRTVGLFAAFGLLMAAVTAVLVHRHLEVHRAEAIREQQRILEAVTASRLREVGTWIRERRADASYFADTASLSGDLAGIVAGGAGAETARASLVTELEGFRRRHGYGSLQLVDPDSGEVLVRAGPEGTESTPPDPVLVARAARDGEVVTGDLSPCPVPGRCHLDFLAPVGAGGAGEGGTAAAVAVLRVDPSTFLFPLLDEVPFASRTAETLLARREGEEIVLLHGPRSSAADPLRIRMPAGDDRVPVVAALAGRRGAMEGVDFRGVPVLASVGTVPGTEWGLAVKVDRAEVDQAHREHAVTTSLAGALVVLLGGVLTWTVLWRQRVREELRSVEEERRRRDAEYRFETLLRQAHDIILLADEDLRIVDFNERAVEAYGYPREALLGMGVQDLREPGGVRSAAEELATLSTGESRTYETVHRRRDGETFPVEVNVGRVRREGRVFFQAILRDISDRKRAEEALRRSEERLHTVVREMPVMVVAMDERERFVFWNRECERVTGYAAGEIMGDPRAFERLQPDPAERERKRRDWARTGGNHRDWAWRIRCKDGAERTVLLSTLSGRVPVPGWPAWGIGIDVTRRMEAEEALRSSEARLLQAQKMEAVGRLAGGVAHDFNNLLTVINGYSDLLMQRRPAGDPDRGHLEQIRRAGESAAGLTRQLLAFSRRQVVQPRVLDLNQAVAHLQKMLRRVIGEDIELEADLEAGLRPVRLDPSQVDQVLMNLVVNARDAMPLGGRLRIATANAEGPLPADGPAAGSFVRLTVEDTGTGMDPGVLDHIFEPFFTTKGQGKGTGLGLATVYGIVTQAEGHIAVRTAPGKGAAFDLFFPALAPGAGRGVRPEERTEAPRARRGETILLVEDDGAVRRLAREVLLEAGYRVEVASDPGGASALLDGGGLRPDLLVTDLVMPGMNGSDLAELARRLHPGVRVLFISGYTGEEILRNGVLEGEEFLPKPFDPETLLVRVRSVLDDRPTPASA